eukprot:403358011
MQMPGMPAGMPGQKKKADTAVAKLIKNDKNNRIYQFINKGYALFIIVGSFGRKLLWFSSCMAFMFVLPMGFEIFSEQSKILAKIQMQMMNDSMMGGMGGMDAQPNIRPF